jgi:chemotaxis protein CheD
MVVAQGLDYHFLYASSIYVDKKATEIQTVLGSCVSVCMYDVRLNFGGMNHYMLPLWNGDGLATAKYGNIAIDKLLGKMLSLGSDQKNIIAKVFGGANQLGENSFYSVGRRNIQLAEDVLATHRVRIMATNVGGTIGRKILFHSGTGMVYMKFVSEKIE